MQESTLSDHETWPVWEFTGEYNDEGGYYRTLLRAKPELQSYEDVIEAFQNAVCEVLVTSNPQEIAEKTYYEDQFRVSDAEEILTDEVQLKHGVLIIPELPTLDGGEQWELRVDLDDERLDGFRGPYMELLDAHQKEMEAKYGKR